MLVSRATKTSCAIFLGTDNAGNSDLTKHSCLQNFRGRTPDNLLKEKKYAGLLYLSPVLYQLSFRKITKICNPKAMNLPIVSLTCENF